jgi:hypothetical protein
MSKGDIVDEAYDVPDTVIADLMNTLATNQQSLRAVFRQAFLEPDFVRF